MIESVFAPILAAAIVITVVLRALYRRASHGETRRPARGYEERRKAS